VTIDEVGIGAPWLAFGDASEHSTAAGRARGQP
jgi:hypothetical protein